MTAFFFIANLKNEKKKHAAISPLIGFICGWCDDLWAEGNWIERDAAENYVLHGNFSYLMWLKCVINSLFLMPLNQAGV